MKVIVDQNSKTENGQVNPKHWMLCFPILLQQ